MGANERAPRHLDLGKRERQIMEAVYRRGRASVGEIRAELASPPSYSAVRTMVGKLEDKGLLRHHAEGPRYVYEPTMPLDEVGPTTLRRVVATLFGGSALYVPAPVHARVRFVCDEDGAAAGVVPADNLPVMRAALERAGNQDFELFAVPGADHGLRETGGGADLPAHRRVGFGPSGWPEVARWLGEHVDLGGRSP